MVIRNRFSDYYSYLFFNNNLNIVEFLNNDVSNIIDGLPPIRIKIDRTTILKPVLKIGYNYDKHINSFEFTIQSNNLPNNYYYNLSLYFEFYENSSESKNSEEDFNPENINKDTHLSLIKDFYNSSTIDYFENREKIEKIESINITNAIQLIYAIKIFKFLLNDINFNKNNNEKDIIINNIKIFFDLF